MGYEIHITRRRYWVDPDEENPISEEEFNALVAADPQLELRDDCFSTLKDGTRRYPAFLVGNVEVAEPHIHPDENGMVPGDWNWLEWSDGDLDSKYPSTNMIRKMIEVAERLNAHVEGDDGEIYFLNESGEVDLRQPDN